MITSRAVFRYNYKLSPPPTLTAKLIRTKKFNDTLAGTQFVLILISCNKFLQYFAHQEANFLADLPKMIFVLNYNPF